MSRNHTGYNSQIKDDWRSFLVPTKDTLTLPRKPRGLTTYGPDELRIREDIIYEGGPVAFVRNNPQLFATSSTSAHEGFFYWALVKKVGKENEYGYQGLIWQYQVKLRGAAGGPGGATVDFVISNTAHGLDLGVRIVTPYYHSGAGALKRGEDFEQMYTMMDSGVYPVDVYSLSYISDETGRAAIKAVEKAIATQPDYSPLYRQGVY